MNFLKKISIKIKIFLIIIGSIFAAMMYFYIRSNLRLKQQMEYALSKIKKETELANLEVDAEIKEKKILELKKQEDIIRNNIKIIEEKEAKGETITTEELASFFTKRGF